MQLLDGKIAKVAGRLAAARISRTLLQQSAALVAGKKSTADGATLRAVLAHKRRTGEWDTKALLPRSNLAGSPQIKSALVLLVAQCIRQQQKLNAADEHVVSALVHATCADIAGAPSPDPFLLENTMQMITAELKLLV